MVLIFITGLTAYKATRRGQRFWSTFANLRGNTIYISSFSSATAWWGHDGKRMTVSGGFRLKISLPDMFSMTTATS